jgi:hypothetical protein
LRSEFSTLLANLLVICIIKNQNFVKFIIDKYKALLYNVILKIVGGGLL